MVGEMAMVVAIVPCMVNCIGVLVVQYNTRIVDSGDFVADLCCRIYYMVVTRGME